MKQEEFKNLIKQTVRKLRRNQTEAEAMFWQVVRNRKLLGRKFLRQHPIVFKWYGKRRFLITDFYCHEAGLIVEIDGGIHEKQKEYDKMRDYVIKSMGLKIIRFKNEMIVRNMPKVLEKLGNELTPHTPSLIKRGGAQALAGRG